MIDLLDKAHAAPKFATPDPGNVAAWYRDYLGFPKISIFEGGSYAIVRRGAFTLHLWQCESRHVAENTACYVEMRDVNALNALHAQWLAVSQREGFAPGRIDTAPQDQLGHGMREFHVWDPAGNLIGFGANLT